MSQTPTGAGGGLENGRHPDDTDALSALSAPAGPALSSAAQHEAAWSAQERRLQAELPPGTAALIVLAGPQAGARFLLDAQTLRIGRDRAVDILLDHVTVSRKHAVITRLDGEYTVRDEGSLNGTLVNGLLVENSHLRGGDVLQIGTFRMRFLHRPPVPAG